MATVTASEAGHTRTREQLPHSAHQNLLCPGTQPSSHITGGANGTRRDQPCVLAVPSPALSQAHRLPAGSPRGHTLSLGYRTREMFSARLRSSTAWM